MDSSIEDIRDELISGNFAEAEKKSKVWLKSFSITDKSTPLYQRACEAYTYSQYFLHRQDRIKMIYADDQRARYYQEILRDLNQIRKENKFEEMDNPLWNAMDKYLHARIAENYARAFAGQKSYNLDHNEIIQLATSLLHLEKWKAAIESLDFLLRLNRHNATVNYLMGFCYGQIDEKIKAHKHIREAMFFKPEVIAEFPEFFPGDVFEKIWKSFETDSEKRESRYREFALLLEINGIYKSDLDIDDKELANLEKDFGQKTSIYEKSVKSPLNLVEILHILCWLIQGFQKKGNYEKVEFFRQKMIALSPETWEVFHSKALK